MEDFEKKYKEALGWMCKIYPILEGANKEDAEHYFPELKENEDEMIRNAIIKIISGIDGGYPFEKYGIFKKDAIAYLEKQKEQKSYEPKNWPADKDNLTQVQKPVDWGGDFEDNIRNLLHDKLTGHSEDGSMSWSTLIDDKTLKDIVNGIWFYVGKEALKYPNKELSQPEWSEEDEKMLNDCIMALSNWREVVANYGHKVAPCQKLIDWLKSLRPQPHWKPSEEQMCALKETIEQDCTVCNGDRKWVKPGLECLYDNLKKL